MAIDNREKRQSVVGVSFFVAPSPTPNASQDLEWRQQAGYGYSGVAAADAGEPFPERCTIANHDTLATIANHDSITTTVDLTQTCS